MKRDVDARLKQEAALHPYPLIFATISGAYLYGFASPDSDYDLPGCNVLPTRVDVGLSGLRGDRIVEGRGRA